MTRVNSLLLGSVEAIDDRFSEENRIQTLLINSRDYDISLSV